MDSERTRLVYRASRGIGKRWGRPCLFHDPGAVRAAKALLSDPGVSSAKAAGRLGVSKTTLRRWFPGYDPDAFRGNGNGNGGKPS